ncbi:MAG: phosphatase PAP2 family protein [Chloroflexota bacterium]
MSGVPEGELRTRNERWLIFAIAGYAVLVVALMVGGGLEIHPDVLAVAFLLIAVLIGRTWLFLRDWVPFVVIFLAYELMRGIADEAGFPVHIDDVIGAERFLALGHLPTQLLQGWLAPPSGVGPAAIVATILYMLHFALPVVTGFLLWLRRRPLYFEYVAAFIVLSFTGFITFLLLPVAPPWYAANQGFLSGPDGLPVIDYLKPDAFAVIAAALGYPNGEQLSSYIFFGVNPNSVAAFPSLHAGYPFLSFLVLRHAFGRIGWLALLYAIAVWWAVIFTGDHYLVDVLGGIAYATAAYCGTRLVIGRLSRRRTRVVAATPDRTPA